MAKIVEGSGNRRATREEFTSDEAEKDQAVRLFVAISLPLDVKEAVTKQQALIRSTLTDVSPRDGRLRWVQPALIHLTLLFLGDVPCARLEDVKSSLRRACAGTSCFELHLSGLGCFPNVRRPRIIWSGVDGNTAALQQLQVQVSTHLQPFVARPDEKKFHPHLTLARIKAEDKKLCLQMGQALQNVAGMREGVSWTVGSVELMHSVLRPSGPEYSREESIPLKAR